MNENKWNLRGKTQDVLLLFFVFFPNQSFVIPLVYPILSKLFGVGLQGSKVPNRVFVTQKRNEGEEVDCKQYN